MLNRPFEAPVSIVTFINDTDMDFVGVWDKVQYPFAPGEKMRMEDWKARHFAKHLFDQWCFANGKDNRRKEQWAIEKMASYIIEDGSSPATSAGEISKLRSHLLSDGVVPSYPTESDQVAAQRIVKNNDRFCDQCDSKGGRHKKACPKANIPNVATVV